MPGRDRECSILRSFNLPSLGSLGKEEQESILRESIHLVCSRSRRRRGNRIPDLAWHVYFGSEVLMINAIWNAETLRDISVSRSQSLVLEKMIEIVEDFKTRGLFSLEEEFFARESG